MLLDQADALVLRGRIRFDHARGAAQTTDRQEIERAGDDLDQALTLARSCGYAWAEHDALTHLAEAHTQLGDQAKAAALGREAATLSRRLLDTMPPDPNPFAWVYEKLEREEEQPEPAAKPRRRAHRKRA